MPRPSIISVCCINQCGLPPGQQVSVQYLLWPEKLLSLCGGCALRWSDLSLFAIFKNRHYAADHVYIGPNPKNRRILPGASGKVFFSHRP